jgi:hypothetical protein
MTSANLRLLDKSAGVTGVGSGDLLGIKDVKSIIKSGKSKRSPTASSALARRFKPERTESKLTRRGFLISIELLLTCSSQANSR